MKIHQIFFPFPPFYENIEKFPEFMYSMQMFKQNDCEYQLWGMGDVDKLIEKECPEFKDFYDTLRYPIQRLDVAKYLICHFVGGFYADLDVRPLKPVKDFVQNFDLLQVAMDEKNRAQNDVIYCPKGGLPNVLEALRENYDRCLNIPIYKSWRFRFILQSTGDRWFHRYLKTIPHVKKQWATRIFTDPKFTHLSTNIPEAPLLVIHRTTWKDQLVPKRVAGG